MPQDTHKRLTQVLKKIPILSGLSPTQIQRVLSLCKARSLEGQETLFEKGSPSNEMFVLLSGELSVKKEDGTLITTIVPVTTVGEIGIITREPRAVTISAVVRSTLVGIPKSNFDMLLHADSDVSIRILRNVVALLSKRLDEDNVRRVDFDLQSGQLMRLQGELDTAVELLMANGLSEDKARDAITRKLSKKLKTVLIVDDDESIRSLLREVLQEFNVVEAEDGEEALKSVGDSVPDVVITDVNMPKIDGLKLLCELKDNYPDLPVIGISGYVKDGQGDSLGFDSFIYKPFQMQVLRRQVKDQLKRV